MTYHDNVVRFKIEHYKLVKVNNVYGTFTINDYCISDGQDPDKKIQKDNPYKIEENGEITFHFGRHGSEKVANWWVETKKIESDQTTFDHNPSELNFAAVGDLLLNIQDERTSVTKTITIPNVAIAQGHSGASNNWWFGGNDFSYIGSHTVYGTNNSLDIKCFFVRGGNSDVNEIIVRFDEYNNICWMKNLWNQSRLCELSIPGTHDSGTAEFEYFINSGQAHCQNFNILEQLRDGVRFFDIRISPYGGISHGLIDCKESWSSVISDMINFLKNHNSEFIVLLVGSALTNYWNEEMKEAVKKAYQNNKDFFYQQTEIDGQVTVEELRGKIVVLKRQEKCPIGILLEFEKDATFSYNNFVVEDKYNEHNTNEKIKSVTENLNNAIANVESKIFITFNSIAGTITHTPYNYAWGGNGIDPIMNKELMTYMKSSGGKHSFGIVVLDFYNDHGEQPELINSIINSNDYNGPQFLTSETCG